MARTEYKNHSLELVVESDIPMSLFEDSRGERLAALLFKLKYSAGIRSMVAEQTDPGPPPVVTITVEHNNGTYEDQTAFIGDPPVPAVVWPVIIDDPWPLAEYAFFMNIRNQLRATFAAFRPTLVEIIFL